MQDLFVHAEGRKKNEINKKLKGFYMQAIIPIWSSSKHPMWRQNTLPGHQDLDHSISDEEDFNVDLRDKCVSLGGHSEKEEGVQLQSRLDILKGTHGVNCGMIIGNLSPEKQTSVSLEDEVEMRDFADEVGAVYRPRKASTCNSDEEAISDDEENVLQKFSVAPGVKTFHKDGIHDFGSGKPEGENAWSEVNKEAEALIHLNENAPCSSSSHSAYKLNKSGIQSKSKPKFSFLFQSQRGGPSSTSISKDEKGVSSKDHEVPKRFKTIDCGKHSIDKLCPDFLGKKAKQSEIVSDEVEDLHCCSEHSMAELLDGLQYSRPRGKRMQVDVKKSISSLGDRMLSSEDIPQHVGSTSSSDDNANDQNLKLAVPEMKRQTIVDRFQEALGATSRDKAAFVAAPRAYGVGLFGKLKQVVQNEKHTDMEFLKLQTRASPNDERSHIDVKILSRYLDAKLIVCHASFGKDIECPQWLENNQKMVNEGKERTIIFNPRVCCDVDVAVGNSIRIHFPWKEVQVRGHDGSIILSTYFSQIST